MTEWGRVGGSDGTSTFRLASWSHFFDFVEAEIFSTWTAQGLSKESESTGPPQPQATKQETKYLISW